MERQPFAVRSGSRTSNFSHESRASLAGAQPEARLQEIPNVIGMVVFADASGFKLPDPGSNGVGRNIFEAPGYSNLDLGIQKLWHVTEAVRLQLRAEMFNAFNHPNFDNPNVTTSSSVFGKITSAGVQDARASSRQIQFALRLAF